MAAETNPELRWSRLFWIVPLAVMVYVAGQALAANVLAATPLESPQMSHSQSTGQLMPRALISALIIALGVAPLARWLKGGMIARWSVLAVFIYLVHTANTVIEVTIFTTIGGHAYLSLIGLLPALLCAGVLTMIPPCAAAPLGLADGQSGLAWRLAVGWLAFPAAYLTFGILIAPQVIEAYSERDGIIVVPPIGTIIGVQAIRSMIFLLPTIAVIERWTGNRLALWLALGWAHWALVGLSSLVMPLEFMSPKLRLIHSLEIGADSFAFTGIVIAVLAARRENRKAGPSVSSTDPNPVERTASP